MNDVGPIELIYSFVDSVFDTVQGAVHLHKFSDFIDSVRWQEPFIRGLLGVQFLFFLVTYATRRNDVVQFTILFLLTAISLMSETLNEYGREHWKSFATQNYFDRNGLFMLVFVSGPFIIMANFIVIGMFLRLVKLYARRKRREVAMRRQQASSSRQEENTPSSSATDTKKSN